MELPKKYDPKVSEHKWQKYWETKEIFKFNPNSKAKIYSIDTPPPTVSGKMHIGHAFSYTQQDILVRYKRMKGFNIFYPFGTDDNGLPTERLIESEKKVKANSMERKEFTKLCLETLKGLRKEYVADWKAIGMSCDWSIFYTTIDEHCQRISQKSFIDLYKADRAYRKEAPITICPHCKTAIAQVEMEDLEKPSTLNYIKTKLETGEFLIYATTRPELLPGCVGMCIHEQGTYVKSKKDSETWIISKEAFKEFKDKWNLDYISEIKGQKLINKEVILPLTKAKIKIIHDEESKTEYGTGIVYYCTYGGMECVEWMTRHPEAKPLHIMDITGNYNKLAGKYQGMNSEEARKQILIDLEEDGSLVLKEKIKHITNVHDRCGTPIEYVATKQWFIKYLDLKKKLLQAGEKIDWYPKFMKNRYDNWVKGLKWDWCISRQRYFGVPFPVWYCRKCDEPIIADESNLPIDPLNESPKKACPKCKSKEFIPDKDIFDTWATSSLSPQITASLFPKLYNKIYPMSMRPQAHDIITFWLFNTVVKSQLHSNKNPWKEVVISGWALDPHGKKMSKSKGNIVEPQEMIEKYSADCLRFWSASSKLGDDLPFQEKELVTGQKLVNKLWNASKFVIMHLEDYNFKKPKKLEAFDTYLLSKLNKLIESCTKSFEEYEYSKVKKETEYFFWHTFCDNYLEISKDRLYNPDKRSKASRESAQYTLYQTLLVILKLFSPIVPHITEEIYHLYFKKQEKEPSIHITKWPKTDKIDDKMESKGDEAIKIISEVRQFKAKNNKSLKTEIELTLPKNIKTKVEDFLDDIKATTNAKDIKFNNKLEIKF